MVFPRLLSLAWSRLRGVSPLRIRLAPLPLLELLPESSGGIPKHLPAGLKWE